VPFRLAVPVNFKFTGKFNFNLKLLLVTHWLRPRTSESKFKLSVTDSGAVWQ